MANKLRFADIMEIDIRSPTYHEIKKRALREMKAEAAEASKRVRIVPHDWHEYDELITRYLGGSKGCIVQGVYYQDTIRTYAVDCRGHYDRSGKQIPYKRIYKVYSIMSLHEAIRHRLVIHYAETGRNFHIQQFLAYCRKLTKKSGTTELDLT